MCNIVNNYVSTILSIYDVVIKTYENNIDIIKQSEDETQDLLHEIELSKSKDMYSGYLLYKELKDCRERRRKAKDENEILEEFYSFCKSQNGTKNQLSKIQGNSQIIYNKQENRQYSPKERSDLTITNKVCNKNKPFEELLQNFRDESIQKKKYKFA